MSRGALSPAWGARPAAMVIGLALVTTTAVACRPGYVLRVGVEHLRYVSRAQPITEALEQTADPVERRRLQLVLDARDFASEQGLDVGGSYSAVADTEGLATAHVVTAAHVDRLEAYEWRYPVVGRIPYRGYFEREHAERFAAKLERDGFDAHVVEAAGYSTLGWFDDPLPSGLLALDDVALVSVVLHELVHQTIYVGGHIDFNETLASAVGQRSTIEFFSRRGELENAELARSRHEQWLAQAELLERLAERLTSYFEHSHGIQREVMLEGRSAIYADALPDLRELELVADQDAAGAMADLNNAVFLGMYRYRRRARLVDDYLAGSASMSDALDQLKAQVEQAEDPYEVLAADSRARSC